MITKYLSIKTCDCSTNTTMYILSCDKRCHD